MRSASTSGPRFTTRHTSANQPDQLDAVSAFMAQRQITASAVTVGADDAPVAGTAAAQDRALDLGELPRLEVYDGAGAYRDQCAPSAAPGPSAASEPAPPF